MFLYAPAGRNGPKFLMTGNYLVLKGYNFSDSYALSVAHLADRLKGGGDFADDWPRQTAFPNLAQRKAVQEALIRLGLYDGVVDGRIGPISQAAYAQFQAQHGQVADGFITLQAYKDLARKSLTAFHLPPNTAILPAMFRRLILIVLLSLFAVAEFVPALVTSAYAQEQPKKRKTLFDMIFGGGEEQPEVPVVEKPVTPKTATLPPPKPAIEKNTGATSPRGVRRLAGGRSRESPRAALRRGPEHRHHQSGCRFIRFRTAGLLRLEQRPPSSRLRRTVSISPSMIVGINDRQSMKVDGKSFKPLTAEWSDAYQARAKAFVDAIHGSQRADHLGRPAADGQEGLFHRDGPDQRHRAARGVPRAAPNS